MRNVIQALVLSSLWVGCAGQPSSPTGTPSPAPPPSSATPSPSQAFNASGASDPATSLSLHIMAPAELPQGMELPVAAMAIDPSGGMTDVTQMVSWSSSNLMVIAVAAGTLHGVGTGTATIRARLGEQAATADVTVTPVTLEGLTIDASAQAVALGETSHCLLLAHFSDGSSMDVTEGASLSSSDLAVARIGEKPGDVRGFGQGTATITAVYAGWLAQADLTVLPAKLTAVRVVASSLTMSAAESRQLTATGVYSDGSTGNVTAAVAWTTSDAAVATVSNGPASPGLVYGVAAGNVAITATAGDVSGSIDLTVY